MVFPYYCIILWRKPFLIRRKLLHYHILYLGQQRRKSASEEIKAILSGKTSIKKIISTYSILTLWSSVAA